MVKSRIEEDIKFVCGDVRGLIDNYYSYNKKGLFMNRYNIKNHFYTNGRERRHMFEFTIPQPQLVSVFERSERIKLEKIKSAVEHNKKILSGVVEQYIESKKIIIGSHAGRI